MRSMILVCGLLLVGVGGSSAWPQVARTAVGTKYEYEFLLQDLPVCLGEFVKVSDAEWIERAAAETPTACLAGTGTFSFRERSSEADYIVVYDRSRDMYLRLDNTAVGVQSEVMWRLATEVEWKMIHRVVRKK